MQVMLGGKRKKPDSLYVYCQTFCFLMLQNFKETRESERETKHVKPMSTPNEEEQHWIIFIYIVYKKKRETDCDVVM